MRREVYAVERYAEHDPAIEPVALAPAFHHGFGPGLRIGEPLPESIARSDEPRRTDIERRPETVLALIWRVRTIIRHNLRQDGEGPGFASDDIAGADKR